ncbi:hypothetical protein PIB30_024131 [Stylosanthes scabra]|uniref:BRO1 domain-containing protein n=1 Tax=Stylosanthes scabra TaxID=79078 RepID=A0ABU6W7V5_9FABA|nr:hypothetical protein [Stylosanthes scabra]
MNPNSNPEVKSDVPILNSNPNASKIKKAIPVKKPKMKAIPVKKTDVPLVNPNPNPPKMLAIPLKKSDPVELYWPLRNLVVKKYSESDAQKVESILKTLNKCRVDMVQRVNLSLPMQLNCLVHYFKCLYMVEPLFTDISSNSDPIIFSWYDAFDSDYICVDGVSSQHNNIQLEKAAVLFNLGAIYSQIGASCDRTTALGRHLAIDAFNAAANVFLKLSKEFAKDVSTTLDLTVLFAQSLHHLFSAQASELKLQQQDYEDKYVCSAMRKYRCSYSFKSVSLDAHTDFTFFTLAFLYDDCIQLSMMIQVSKLYRRAYDLILSDSAATEHVYSFDRTWVTHLYQKGKFFQVEATKLSIPHESKQTEIFSLVQSCTLVHDAESDSPFKIVDGGKLVANPWDMPPPYPKNLTILSSSSSSHILAFPLKKTEPLDLYEPLRSYFVLKCSESVAKSLEGLLETLAKLRGEIQRNDLSLLAHRDCLISYFKCLCMIDMALFPMIPSQNPLTFVWYNAFNPQENFSQSNIHLEKASVLFNLGALCTHIAASCDLTTIQGYRVAIDALNEASHWFQALRLDAMQTVKPIDLSEDCIKMLLEIISAEISDSKWNFPHPQSDGLTLSGYPVSVLYRKAYTLSTSRPLAVNLAQSSIPQYLESKMKMKSCIVESGPGDVTDNFLSGYFRAKSLLSEGCQPPCLDLLSEVGPVKIKDGNIVANATLKEVGLALMDMSLQDQ